MNVRDITWTSLEEILKEAKKHVDNLYALYTPGYSANIAVDGTTYIDNFYDFISNLKVGDISFKIESENKNIKDINCWISANHVGAKGYRIEYYKELEALIVEIVKINRLNAIKKVSEINQVSTLFSDSPALLREASEKVNAFLKKNALTYTIFKKDGFLSEETSLKREDEIQKLKDIFKRFVNYKYWLFNNTELNVGDEVYINDKGKKSIVKIICANSEYVHVKGSSQLYKKQELLVNRVLNDPCYKDVRAKIKELYDCRVILWSLFTQIYDID